MILGVNGIRLIGKQSGVGRVIQSILQYMGDVEHPFNEIRYTKTFEQINYTPSQCI